MLILNIKQLCNMLIQIYRLEISLIAVSRLFKIKCLFAMWWKLWNWMLFLQKGRWVQDVYGMAWQLFKHCSEYVNSRPHPKRTEIPQRSVGLTGHCIWDPPDAVPPPALLLLHLLLALCSIVRVKRTHGNAGLQEPNPAGALWCA